MLTKELIYEMLDDIFKSHKEYINTIEVFVTKETCSVKIGNLYTGFGGLLIFLEELSKLGTSLSLYILKINNNHVDESTFLNFVELNKKI